MVRISFFAIVLLIGLAGIILTIILICVWAGRKKKQPAVPDAPSSPTLNPAERNRKREAILEKLAVKELSREDAEQQLLELDKPLPEQMPTPPPTRNGCKSGCLVAGIIAGVIAALLILILLMFFGYNIPLPV